MSARALVRSLYVYEMNASISYNFGPKCIPFVPSHLFPTFCIFAHPTHSTFASPFNPPFSELMKWKLGRGKFRPRLQQLAESNPPQRVVDASASAFRKLDADDLKGAVEDLCVLKVGSLVLLKSVTKKCTCEIKPRESRSPSLLEMFALSA